MKTCPPYHIEEVTEPDSPHMPGMILWLEQIFPDYSPRFQTLLSQQRHADGRSTAQIFVALSHDQVVGLMQMFYRPWQDGLLAYMDLLGVLESHRRSGLGSALVRQAILATHDISRQHGLAALGKVSLADPAYSPIIRLHQKLGAQIRTDLHYPDGDIIIWYPLSEACTAVATKTLAWQLWQFGDLPPEEFIRLYGKP